MLMETHTGQFMEVELQQLQQMTREQLIKHLELRGFACYDHETTDLLRETAIEDWEGQV